METRTRRALIFAVAAAGIVLFVLRPPTSVLGEGEEVSTVLPPGDVVSPSPLPVRETLDEVLGKIERLIQEERLLEARTRLAAEIWAFPSADSELRNRLSEVNEQTLFSRRHYPGDPHTGLYRVQAGDSLERIVRRLDLGIDWRLLQRINELEEPGHIRFGQSLKIVRGPFHARVVKHAFRVDLYLGPEDRPEEWLYVRSFEVGLGERDSTPVGTFVVKKGGKVVDPFWTDPKSRKWFAPGDPENPIGDRWIGLEGVGEYASLDGYGFHGTIEPESVGREGSLGCVRLRPRDVHLLYDLLTEGRSRIVIEP